MTIKTECKMVPVHEITEIICDKCGRTTPNDGEPKNILEFQEYYSIKFTGGYGSIFGDMVPVVCDLCQHCLMDMIGPIYNNSDEVKGP